MYFRLQQKSQLLQIDNNFAHLKNVSDTGSLSFEFTYSISHRDAVGNNAYIVSVDVESRHIAKKPLLGKTSRGIIDTRGLVDNVRSSMIDAKSTLEKQTTFLLASRKSDITSLMNNDVLPQLRARTPVSQISAFTRPRLALVSVNDVNQNNDPQPILHRLANSLAVPDIQLALTASAGENPQALMHDMIIRQGLDPSHILKLAPRFQSEEASHGGLTNPMQAIERATDPASRLLNYHLFPASSNAPPKTTNDVVDSEMVHVLQNVTDDTIELVVPIEISNSVLQSTSGGDLTQAFVTFKLIDSSTNLPVDTVVKTLDISKHLQTYHTPKVPPRVTASASELASRVNLEIKQIDPGATEVQVLKKAFWVSSTEIDTYTLIGTYALTSSDQSLLVQVDRPTSSPALYRIIASGRQSMRGFEYTNVAIKPARYVPVRAVALTAHQVDTGIKLEVRHMPLNAVAIQFLRWNMTTFDSASMIVGGDVGFIDDAVRQTNLLTIIDTAVASDNIYRYVARVIYSNGSTNDFGDMTVEFIKPSPGEVDTRVSNLIVSHTNVPNVTFVISTLTVDTDLDSVKRMLEQQNLSAFFEGDLSTQRDQLKKLIAHIVYRVDLTTGERESFGVLTSPQFDDDALRKNLTIKPLAYGHKYRYEIYPLLRASETMFDSFMKKVVDPVTKKSYSFSPAKFLHPLTLRRGIIVTAQGAKQRYAKDPMAYGIIGSITTLDVSFDGDTAQVIDPVASSFDRRLNIVSWKISGDIHQVDHFLIFKDVHGMRSVVGKAHTEFTNGSCQYVHPIDNHDIGSLKYVIVPVFNDYKLGQPATTNTLIIEAT